MADGDPKADIASGGEAQLAASAATGERASRNSRSAAPDTQDENARPAAGARADGSWRGSRSHRSGSTTPRPSTSSRRHKHRSQGNGRPSGGAGDNSRPQDIQEPRGGGDRPRALLSCCKGETHSHREGFRRLARRLHDAGWQPEKLNPRAASLTDGPVTPKALQGAALAVFGCPTRAFTPKEIAALHAFVDQGGSLAVFACAPDSSDADVSANLNALLGCYGIAVNRDALFSIVQQGMLRPREVLVSDGFLCTAVSAAAAEKASAAVTTAGRELPPAGTDSAGGATPRRSRGAAAMAAAPAAAEQQAAAAARAELLCCDGCTLAVSGAAQPLLLSSSMCNPPLRPLGGVSGIIKVERLKVQGSASDLRQLQLSVVLAVGASAAWRGERGGAVVAFGTAAVFDAEALQRPGNAAACDLLFRWLRLGSDVDMGLPPVAENILKACRRPLDIVEQSEQPRTCFQLEPPLPGDWTQLFADDFFEYALQLPLVVQEPGNRDWHENSWDVGSRDGGHS